jgi:hypothetical protein
VRIVQVEFLTSLKQSNIEYVPIDLKCTPDNYTTPAAIIERDKVMSKAYLETKASVFGRVGANHIARLEKHFIEQLGEEKARENFLFFHIYSNKKLCNHDEITSKKSAINVFHLDASKMNEEEVVDFFIEKIKTNAINIDKVVRYVSSFASTV